MNYALGCDTSRYQGDVDFNKMKSAGADFVIVKCSQANYKDTQFDRSWGLSRDAGLLRGLYHFMVWELPAADQADIFTSYLVKDPGNFRPVIDFEWWKETPPNAIDILYQFSERMISNGFPPMIYSSAGFFNPTGDGGNPYWAQFPLWVASYGVNDGNLPTKPWMPDMDRDGNPEPWKDWEFWQYTSKGNGELFGAQNNIVATCKQIDMNVFNGDRNALFAKYGNGAVAITETKKSFEERLTAVEQKVDKLLTGML